MGVQAEWLMAVTTAPSVDVASALVRELVERRLVACGTLLPGAASIYRWQGAIEESGEVVVLLKTTAARWAELKVVLPTLHPYEVPELIAMPVVDGHRPYLDWLSRET
jgi:periplasmic divalent cation tolerance protein